MKLSDEVIASINENGVNVSSAWMWADVDVYNISYGNALVQPISVEAATLNDFRFYDSAGTITVRQTNDPTSDVVWSGYVDFAEDPITVDPTTSVAVDDITIDWNTDNELEVKDGGITAVKLSDGTITDSKLADMPAGMIKGRAVSAGGGPVTNLSQADVHTIIGRGVADGVASLGPDGKVPRSESSDIILSGVVEAVLPDLTIDEGAGSITVAPLRIQAFANANYLDYPERYTTVETVLYPTDGQQQYVVFTQSTGLVSLISSSTTINISNVIPLYVVSKVGTTIHSIGFDTMGHGLPQKNEIALLNTTPYRRSTGGGLALSADNALHVIVSASVVYAGTTPVNVLAYNSTTDILTQCYHVAGVWTYSSASHTYNNTQYDNGTNLVSVGTNKYKWVWCFRSVGDVKEVFYVNGSADYSTPTAANVEKMPAVPPVVGWHCILVGRILIKQGQTTPYDVQSAFDQSFASATVQEHNNLSGIQGGAAGDYQHLTTAQVTSFTNKPTSVFGRTGAVVAVAGDYNTSLVPEGTNLYYTDSRADARITLQKGVAGGIASLDVGGKVPISQIPASAITETFVVASEAAMLALTAQRGDVAVRTDNHTSYILQADPASTLANWVELLSPADGVTSVGLSAPSGFTVSGSPVTNSGTLSFAWNGTSSNFVRADGSTVATSSYLSAAGNPDLVAIEALAGTSGLLKKTAANTWALDTNTYLTGNQTITLSGDASGSGATAIAVTNNKIDVTEHSANNTNYPVVWDNTSRQLFHTASKLLFNPSTGTLTSTAFSGPLTGNASTATTWQTARTLTIGNTGKSVNGSANVSWSLAEIGAQAALTNPVTGTGTANQVAIWNGTTTQYGSANFVFDGTDTLSVGVSASSTSLNPRINILQYTGQAGGGELYISAAGTTSDENSAKIILHGGHRLLGLTTSEFKLQRWNSTSSTWATVIGSTSTDSTTLGLTFGGAITAASGLIGNASTATTWQTARTLTIGSTGKSVNGSANVSWSLAEIGAQALNGNLTALSTGQTNNLIVANGVPSSNYFSNTSTGDTILRWGSPYTENIHLGVMSDSTGSNKSSIRFSASSVGFGYAATFDSTVTTPYGTIRAITSDSTYGCIYPQSVTPGSTNYAITWKNDGTGTSLNGTTSSRLNVNDSSVVVATAGQAAVTGNITATGTVFSSFYSGTVANYYANWNASGCWGFAGNGDTNQVIRAVVTDATGGITGWSSLGVNILYTNNNGNGTNIKVGDDCWIGDINIANTMSVRGVQNSGVGYIRFGSDSNSFGYNGSRLDYGGTLGAYTLTGNSVSANYIECFQFSANGTRVAISNLEATAAKIAALEYNVQDITTSTTLGSNSLYLVNSASDLTLTLPTPTAGRSIKVVVRSSGSNGHRMYPASGHTIAFSGMYGTSYNTFISNPSGISSGVACLLKPGVYEFVGMSSTEWGLSSGPKTYA